MIAALEPSTTALVVRDAAVAWDWHPSDAGGEAILFVHGGRAHRGWWTHVAPLLGAPWAALDLTGHGDSAWRPAYDVRTWALEVAAVAEAIAGRTGALVTVVGHSLGGIVTLQPEVRLSPAVRASISVDGAPMSGLRMRPSTSPPVFADPDAAVAHFSRARDRSAWPADVLRAVAAASVRRRDYGWVWKHDPRTVGVNKAWTDGTPSSSAIILGERSAYRELLAGSAALREPWLRRHLLPGVGHDMMMERPAAFAR